MEMDQVIEEEIKKLPGLLRDELQLFLKQTRKNAAYRPELDPYH